MHSILWSTRKKNYFSIKTNDYGKYKDVTFAVTSDQFKSSSNKFRN